MPGQRPSPASLAALQVPAPLSAAASSSRGPLRKWRATLPSCTHSQEMHSSSGHCGICSNWAPQIQVGVNIMWSSHFRLDKCPIGLYAQAGIEWFQQHGWAGWPPLDMPQVVADKRSTPGLRALSSACPQSSVKTAGCDALSRSTQPPSSPIRAMQVMGSADPTSRCSILASMGPKHAVQRMRGLQTMGVTLWGCLRGDFWLSINTSLHHDREALPSPETWWSSHCLLL